MRERPIIFSAPMVRAILDGRKTVTRRVVKPQPSSALLADFAEIRAMRGSNRTDAQMLSDCLSCPYGAPGDHLWLRESIQATRDRHWFITGYVFSADGEPVPRCPDLLPQFADQMAFAHLARPGGVPSIHMPRWASRITLEIESVRVERLQDISEADAVAEGCGQDGSVDGVYVANNPRGAFFHLWRQINGIDSLRANPYVWVVTFRRITP